ncbi:MAG: response regulator transcription factor [Bacteroidetes bacterium]|nr:response regulator transcription factor [Bacteroidota bacterium]MBS1739394.1 response regulator transcription factor [Bacteroidota bacterium]
MRPNILLVEDEKKLANTIQTGLSEHDYNVTLAYNGKEGKDLFLTNKFDMAILDINLPFLNGYELCKIIRERNKVMPIMLLTALNFTENKVEGFELGADDYISKPFDFKELLVRIKALLRRAEIGKPSSDEIPVLNIANLELDLNRKEARRDNQKITLTAKEFQLLEYFLRNQDKVVSREEISKAVWETDFDPQTNVIDVYVNFLRKKIDKNFTPKLIHTHVGMGYILKDDSN